MAKLATVVHVSSAKLQRQMPALVVAKQCWKRRQWQQQRRQNNDRSDSCLAAEVVAVAAIRFPVALAAAERQRQHTWMPQLQ